MKNYFRSANRGFLSVALACFSLTSPALAQDDIPEKPAPTPTEILAATPADHWLPIPLNDLLVFTLPDATDELYCQSHLSFP